MLNGDKAFSVTTVFYNTGEFDVHFTKPNESEGDFGNRVVQIERFNSRKEAISYMQDYE